MEELSKITSVEVIADRLFTLVIRWSQGDMTEVDMTKILHRVPAFTSLRDQTEFRGVRVIADGLGVGWENGLDYSARSLRILREQQSI